MVPNIYIKLLMMKNRGGHTYKNILTTNRHNFFRDLDRLDKLVELATSSSFIYEAHDWCELAILSESSFRHGMSI